MTKPRHRVFPAFLALFVTVAVGGGHAAGAQAPLAPPGESLSAPQPPSLSYTVAADFVVASPLVIDVVIRSATRIKGTEATGLAPGHERQYVEGDVVALVRGPAAIPARIGWLVDLAPGNDGRLPKLKKRRVIVFARPVAGRVDQVQLVSPAAQIDWSPANEMLVRRIAADAAATDAPPVITGVRSAFHVAGALPGEGETQIFLRTEGGRPAALSVLRRPGEQPRWSVALNEIIDEHAVAPPRDTLLWYRLACALPATLPSAATASAEPADAEQAAADYAFVIAALGPCGRPGAG